MDKRYANLVRLGIGLYGYNLAKDSKLNLKPALRVESIISSIKNLKASESVGYKHTFTARDNMRIATVPIGYYEGVDRRLSNLGFFKIGDNFVKILGIISMNITSIDISKVQNLKIEDRVIIISEKNEDGNSIRHIAKQIETIPYEILIHLPVNLSRKVIPNFID